MEGETAATWLAFEADHCLAFGAPREVVRAIRERLDRGQDASILVFDGANGRPIDLILRGSLAEIEAQIPPLAAAGPSDAELPRGPGRPRLGVVAREVTLLPRHWEWLARQPGGASVSLRRLVDAARRDGEAANRIREAREAAYRLIAAIAGDRPNYEEAIRALFAGDQAGFEDRISGWPTDIREHCARMARPSFA
jgi:hypothetical protein